MITVEWIPVDVGYRGCTWFVLQSLFFRNPFACVVLVLATNIFNLTKMPKQCTMSSIRPLYGE
jgi:hypothetical protein